LDHLGNCFHGAHVAAVAFNGHHLRPDRATDTRTESSINKEKAMIRIQRIADRIQETCEARAELWKEFVAEYQRVLIMEPERFSEYCEKWRMRFLVGAR
jgi:hypothetical protein